MEYRELGSTGLTPSVVGLGTLDDGWMDVERRSGSRVAGHDRRAIELGVNLTDTEIKSNRRRR